MARTTEKTIVIPEVQTRRLQVVVVGLTPLILNRMSTKAQQELLLPRGRKNAAAKQATLKHDPVAEYRASPYTIEDDAAPTRLGMPASAFKKLMQTAALDLPGATKAQIGRLCWVEGELVPIYGVPQLFMRIVRSADINRTPDVRTRCIVPHWAAVVTVSFVVPLLTETAIVNLLAAGGVTAGIGDFRPEKGAGNFGQFRLTSPDDPAFAEIVATGDRAAQDAALTAPECYDAETRELLSWFVTEAEARGLATVTGQTRAPLAAD